MRLSSLKMAFALRLNMNPIIRPTIRHFSINSDNIVAVPSDALVKHPSNNVPEHIASKLGQNLHLQPNHPIATIRSKIEDYWNRRHVSIGAPAFACVSGLHPVVNVAQNFDDLLIKKGHVSRRPSDTYYVDSDRVLRTHTSAHQSTLLSQGLDAFLVTGDVYRRDEIDRSHYPVFHQMEGVRMFQGAPNDEKVQEEVVDDLKKGLEGMVRELFGHDTPQRWVDAYFPFTNPSLELEVFYEDKWMEVLGCGVIQRDILTRAGREDVGWAFGLGLERLAMVLFKIPDIRLFWSQDDRFLSQFKAGEVTMFKPFSSHPPCSKDISFWLPKGATVADWDLNAEGEEKSNVDEVVVKENVLYHPNDLFELVREVGGDIVESVELIDEFSHPKTQRLSQCYRVTYRHMTRTLTNEEVDKLQLDVRELIASKLGVELR